MKKQIIIWFITVLLFELNLYAQNQANTWYFGYMNGLDFNSGYPEYLPDCPRWLGFTTSVSDTNGNLLFFTDGQTVWNKDREVMQNGDGLHGDWIIRQPAVICNDPGNPERYYLFTVGSLDVYKGLEYNIIDMSLDNGRGAIIEKNVVVSSGQFAKHKITAVRQANNNDWWIITRFQEPNNPNAWASFSLTSSGLNPVPIISPAYHLNTMQCGPVKVSHDRKKLISVQTGNANSHGSFDVCDFDKNTGIISHRFHIKEHCDACFGIYGMEMSPDSKLLYISFDALHLVPPNQHFTFIYQYDLTITDSLDFLNSRLTISTNSSASDLQLAPDGKIYVTTTALDPLQGRYLGAIHNVWKRGIFCNYEISSVEVGTPNNNFISTIPSFPSELLYRFVWQGGPCAKTPITFRHRFIPEPDSIVWDFGDGTTSTDFNPTHIFQSGGNYEVHAHVVYPDERIEETSREVEVLAAPEPDLGDDILMCSNATVELDAGSGFTQYVWNGQFPPGNQYYTVTDTGYYRIRVKNGLNCFGYDTVHVALYPSVFLDVSQAEISNTTCNNSTGAIRGILVSPAAIIEWRDGSGNLAGSEIDITGLPVGNYLLTIIDTTGCITEVLPAFTINNTDSDLIIQDAVPSDASCGQANGSVVIKTSVFSDLLQYSIDDGNTWHDNLGIFQNVPPGPCMVRVKDIQGCVAVYDNNPVWVNDTGGPVVTFSGSTNATGSNSNGTITVTANGDSLYYQLNSGTAQDTGYFEGLAPDLYYITISDKFGCDTTVSVLVISETGYQLSALAGGDRQCLRKMATSVLKVSNLNGVKDFKATILFNSLLLECFGYDQPFHDNLTVTEFPDRIELEWHGNLPLTLTDTVSLVHLIFETKLTGVADVNWDMAGSSYFRDENGINIPCTPIDDGEIMISDPPVLVTNGDQRKCEEEVAVISADAFLGVPPYTHEWILPDGTINNESSIWLFNVGAQNAGEYIIKVTDHYNCVAKDTVRLVVIPPPSANIPNDTIPFEQQFTLEATPGYFSYQWNTGDTTYFITGNEEGSYSVIIQTEEGCTAIDSAYLKDVYMPFYFNVPNAFTPNNDGLNDTFRPVIDYERVRMFSMAVYNHWGQLIFETTNPSEGWDGKDSPAGVYSWVISYSNHTGKLFKMRGSVTLLK